MRRRTACLLAAWGLMEGARADAPRLRFLLGQSWGPPFVERIGPRVLGGLLPDLMTAIAAEMGLVPEFVMLPPARVDAALADGSVDLQCFMSPSWWGDELPPPARWSPPLLPLRDMLVASSAGPADAQAYSQALAVGASWTLATVRGYRYPKLEIDIGAGRLQRHDTLDQWGVLEMLARSRTQLGVVNEITLKTYQQRNPQAPLRALLLVDEVPGHCLIAERPAFPAARIQAAIRQLIAKGRLAQTLEPYQ